MSKVHAALADGGSRRGKPSPPAIVTARTITESQVLAVFVVLARMGSLDARIAHACRDALDRMCSRKRGEEARETCAVAFNAMQDVFGAVARVALRTQIQDQCIAQLAAAMLVVRTGATTWEGLLADVALNMENSRRAMRVARSAPTPRRRRSRRRATRGAS